MWVRPCGAGCALGYSCGVVRVAQVARGVAHVSAGWAVLRIHVRLSGFHTGASGCRWLSCKVFS